MPTRSFIFFSINNHKLFFLKTEEIPDFLHTLVITIVKSGTEQPTSAGRHTATESNNPPPPSARIAALLDLNMASHVNAAMWRLSMSKLSGSGQVVKTSNESKWFKCKCTAFESNANASAQHLNQMHLNQMQMHYYFVVHSEW